MLAVFALSPFVFAASGCTSTAASHHSGPLHEVPTAELHAFTGYGLSHDGKSLLTVGTDGFMLWSVGDGEPAKKHEWGKPDQARRTGVSQGWGAGSDRLWLEKAAFEARAKAPLLAMSGDRETAACLGEDGILEIRNARDGALLESFEVGTSTTTEAITPRGTKSVEQRRDPECIALSPDGCLLAGGFEDGSISLWSTGSGRFERSFAVAPIGSWACVGKVREVLGTEDAKKTSLEHTFNLVPVTVEMFENGHERGRVTKLAFSSDGSILVAITAPSAYSWDERYRRAVERPNDGAGVTCYCVQRWRVSDGTLLETRHLATRLDSYPYKSNIHGDVALSPDGATFVALDANDALEVFAIAPGSSTVSFTSFPVQGDFVGGFDGERIATIRDGTGEVFVYSARGGKLLSSFAAPFGHGVGTPLEVAVGIAPGEPRVVVSGPERPSFVNVEPK
jgi:WD40 repeat protein